MGLEQELNLTMQKMYWTFLPCVHMKTKQVNAHITASSDLGSRNSLKETQRHISHPRLPQRPFSLQLLFPQISLWQPVPWQHGYFPGLREPAC